MNRTGKDASMVALVFTAIVFVVVGISLIPISGDRAFGEEGCCMQRECPEDTCQWYVMPGDYDNCKKINDQKDGDDVESESGLIWWSEDC
jgi:hypothetical protein